MDPNTFTQAQITYSALLPLFVVFGAAMIGVLIEAFVPRTARYWAQVAVTLLGLVTAFVLLVTVSRHHQGVTAGRALAIDGFALMMQGTVLVLSFFAVLVMAERFNSDGADAFTQSGASVPGSPWEAKAERLGATTTEVFPLTLFAVAGMMMFPSTTNLLAMFVALEVLSLPLYILTGLARRRRLLSQEAALKYFLLGAFSSALFLFGAAMIYGFAGTLDLASIAQAVSTQAGQDSVLIMGIVLIAVGLLFKVGAVPFHSWTPDVYQGAPTPVSGFMAACTKVAAFGALLRVFYVAFDSMRWTWQPVIEIVALLTMVVGSVLTVTQTDMKRLLAYSSVSHAGFLLLALTALDRSSVAGVQFYVAAYGIATITAFAVVALVRKSGVEATHLSEWAGLGRRNPLLAGVFGFLMLSFAGIPLTAGFTSKFAVFAPAVAHGPVWLVVVAVIVSAITAFVYARVIVLMFFSEPADGVHVVTPSAMTAVTVAAGTALTLALGVLPAPLLDLAGNASQFLR